jgi:hypothetical protein
MGPYAKVGQSKLLRRLARVVPSTGTTQQFALIRHPSEIPVDAGVILGLAFVVIRPGLLVSGKIVGIFVGTQAACMVAQVISPDAMVLMAHTVCRPYVLKAKNDHTLSEANARLPRQFAVMYLDWRGEWRLPPLNGIATAPLLHEDGTITSAEGYDPNSGIVSALFIH